MFTFPKMKNNIYVMSILVGAVSKIPSNGGVKHRTVTNNFCFEKYDGFKYGRTTISTAGSHDTQSTRRYYEAVLFVSYSSVQKLDTTWNIPDCTCHLI